MDVIQAENHGYLSPVQLPDGRIAAISRQIYTYGVVILGEYGPTHRWCYEKLEHALVALQSWDGKGDPPGPWIKQKLPVERMNPLWD